MAQVNISGNTYPVKDQLKMKFEVTFLDARGREVCRESGMGNPSDLIDSVVRNNPDRHNPKLKIVSWKTHLWNETTLTYDIESRVPMSLEDAC